VVLGRLYHEPGEAKGNHLLSAPGLDRRADGPRPRWFKPPATTSWDEGEAYARKLDAAGVDVTAVRYEGLIHDYGLLNALSQIPAVRAALHQAAEELKKHLK
jgi:acetyl esterase/lipase